MIGIDTNILLRYLIKDDDRAQIEAAARLIDETCSPSDPALVGDVVIAETVWYLAKKLRKPKREVVAALFDILDNKHLLPVHKLAMLTAASAYRHGPADFTDYFIAALNREHGISKTFTFDKHAARDGSFVLLGSED